MNEPLAVVMEKSIRIAFAYLEQTGQIEDPVVASRFLSTRVEDMIRRGERRQLLLSNRAITAFEQMKSEARAA